jgi:hypothetical protein
MRQAIEEGFILDVVKNYTTYATHYRLVKAIEDDPRLPRRKAARALARFMSLHPHNLEQKTEENFQPDDFISLRDVIRFTLHPIECASCLASSDFSRDSWSLETKAGLSRTC